MRLEEIEVAVEIIVPHSDAHSRLFLTVFAEGHSANDTLFAKSSVMVVHEKQTWRRIASYVNIRPAVLVEIRGHHRHSVASPEGRHTGCNTHIGKSSIPVVSVEGMRPVRQPPGAAFHGNTLPRAVD